MSFDKQTNRDGYFEQMEAEVRGLIDPDTGKPRTELVEETNCPICGSPGEPVLKKWGFTYDRCQGCHSFFTNPRLKESAVIEVYKTGSKANAMWSESVHLSQVQSATNKEYFSDQIKVLRDFAKEGTILDVGCGTGDFLDQAVANGFGSYGLEISENAVAICRKKGHSIQEELLGSPSLNGKQYDILTMFGVMEHLFDPNRDIKYAWELIRPGGIFMGITPNVFSLAGLLLQEKARFFTPRNHPVLFSSKGVETLLAKNGFKVLKMDTVLSGYESILNFLQYRNPFGEIGMQIFPKKIEATLLNRPSFEKLLYDLDLGLRIRVVAQKV